jgi:large subunit ribosomal protein L10
VKQAILKQKEAVVDEIIALAKDTSALIVVEYRGMDVAEISDLRRLLRGMNAKMAIYKNSMVARAGEKLAYQGFEEHLTGPNAVVFCPDAIEGAKVLFKFARKSGKLQVKAGVIESRVLNSAELKAVSSLPGKLGLISMLLSCIQSPIRQFAATIQAISEQNQPTTAN